MKKRSPRLRDQDGRPRRPPCYRPKSFAASKGARSGEMLIAAMQASPCREIDIEPERRPMPVRGLTILSRDE